EEPYETKAPEARNPVGMKLPDGVENLSSDRAETFVSEEPVSEIVEEEENYVPEDNGIVVFVNGEPVPLTGKEEYIFVDIFDRITFDLTASRGRAIATLVNGREAQFTEVLSDGDKVELYWKEN
ncbi:MAG: cell division protein FtsA, partial [Agathobacter sp.]